MPPRPPVVLTPVAFPRLCDDVMQYETFGEDPLLVSRMGVAAIKGVQEYRPQGDKSMKTAACMVRGWRGRRMDGGNQVWESTMAVA